MSPSPVGQVLILVLWLFLILLIARLVLDYVQMFARSWRPRGPMLVVAEIIYTVTDPPLRALRKVIPPLKIGSVSIDLVPGAVRPGEHRHLAGGVFVSHPRSCATMARETGPDECMTGSTQGDDPGTNPRRLAR